MSGVFKADIGTMLRWAEGIMASRPRDFEIGQDYLRRWWVIPRNDFCNIYLHEMVGSDIDRALHDHPWPNMSVLLAGQYREHVPDGVHLRQAGDVVMREAGDLHRLEVNPGDRVITLFMTGPKVREWGFACAHGWVHWKDFTHPEDSSRVGRGCGEHDDPAPVTAEGMLPERLKEMADATA